MNRGLRVALLAAVLLSGLSPGQAFADPITSAIRKQQALQRYAAGMNNARQASQSRNNYQTLPTNGVDRSVQVNLNLANSYLVRGEITAAIKRFEQVLRMRPNEGEALFQLGLCYEIIGNQGEAIQKFASVPSSHGRYSEAQAKLAALGGAGASIGAGVGAPPAVAQMQDPRYAAAQGDVGYTQDPRYIAAQNRYATAAGTRGVPYGNRSVSYGTQTPQQAVAVAVPTAPAYAPRNTTVQSTFTPRNTTVQPAFTPMQSAPTAPVSVPVQSTVVPMQPVQSTAVPMQPVQSTAVPMQPVQTSTQSAAQSSVTEVGKPVNRPIKDKWALIVGISNFADPTINLKYSAKDAIDFKNYLINSANFEPSHVRTLIDKEATRDRIFDEFGDSWLPRAAGPDDLVVIYVSTHGTPADADDISHVNYLVAYDTDKTKLFSRGIAMQELCGLIKRRIRSDRVLIVLDTCFSGNTAPTGKSLNRTGNVSADEIALGTGQLVICSSSTYQRSWESKLYENSIFTRKLIESLQTNGSKTTLGQAFAALKDKVEDEARRQYAVTQTPCMNGKWSGNDLILAVPPTAPKPGL